MGTDDFRRVLPPGGARGDERADIRAEIELYLELRTEELIAQGLSPEEARRTAEQRFGDAGRIEAALAREARRRRVRHGGRMTMGGWMQDLRYALRGLRRSPGFAAVAILTLGLAIGGATAIYSVVDATLLGALPFADADELFFVNGYQLVDGRPSIRGASYPEFRDWRERSQSFTGMAAVAAQPLPLAGEGPARTVTAEFVTEDYFALLRLRPRAGRFFRPEEHGEPDAYPVALVSERLWHDFFGGDEGRLGERVTLVDRPVQVVGVVPAGFHGTSLDADVWLPESLISLVANPRVLNARGARSLTVFGRLRPGVTPQGAQAELDRIARELQEAYPRAHEDRFALLQSFREGYVGSTATLLWILLGAAGLLLLIAAANVANLLLVRAQGRTRELALRQALGARVQRVASQLLTESLLLAALGGALGLAMARWALDALAPAIPPGILPAYVRPALSLGGFGVALATLLAVGVLTGLAPVLSGARLELAGTLRDGGQGAGRGVRRSRLQRTFVIVQVALALVLLAGAGLLTRSFRAYLSVDTGIDLHNVVALRTTLPRERYPTPDDVRTFERTLEARLAALPGVEAVSLSSDLPLRGGGSASYIFRDEAPDERIRFHSHDVSPGYFETLGIRLVEGRLIDEGDRADTRPVVVISRAMQRRLFPEGGAVGRTLYLRPGRERPVEIVGVIEDVRHRDLTTSLMAEANSPDVYFPLDQGPSLRLQVAARSARDPATVLAALRRTVLDLDGDLAITQEAPLLDAYRAQTAVPRFAAFLMGAFSVLALVLACVGVYGVLAYSVAQRGREIAIRRAIGATGGSVARHVVGDGVRLALLGLVIGTGAALLGGRLLEGFLFGVEPVDPLTLLSVGGLTLAVAVLASALPALRAMRRDPAEALGAE